jgi:hypothetical protein
MPVIYFAIKPAIISAHNKSIFATNSRSFNAAHITPDFSAKFATIIGSFASAKCQAFIAALTSSSEKKGEKKAK